MKKHKPCHCVDCEKARYWEPCTGCAGGHPSFWKTVTESKYWKLWEKENEKRLHRNPVGECFDVDECKECGIIGEKHFEAFISFIKTL